jgi:hypothetical protein
VEDKGRCHKDGVEKFGANGDGGFERNGLVSAAISVGVKSYQGRIMEGLLVLAVWVVIAWFCTEIAVNRGHSRSRWSFLALFFGPFALAAILLLPRVSNASSAASQVRHS